MKGLVVGDPQQGLVVETQKSSEVDVEWTQDTVDFNNRQVKDSLLQYDVSVIQGEPCHVASRVVKKRSVGSHFLNYIDVITQENQELWGHSLFSVVFKEVLLSSIENQDFKGAVIFLGHSSLALPIIEVLAGFGFEDFVFLQHQETDFDFSVYNSKVTGLLGTQVSKVDSTAFIQSQKEYSFCFVMEDEYSQQTLEDMGYFHFLSSQSMVFDISGQSNFLFKEVKALGVSVTSFNTIQESWGRHLRLMLQNLPQK